MGGGGYPPYSFPHPHRPDPPLQNPHLKIFQFRIKVIHILRRVSGLVRLLIVLYGANVFTTAYGLVTELHLCYAPLAKGSSSVLPYVHGF